jgi:hypothetical protein
MVREFTEKIAGAELIVDEQMGHFSLVLRRAPAALDYLAECVPAVSAGSGGPESG